MKLAIVPERCSGCKLCEVVCSMSHFNVVNPRKSRVRVMVLYPQPVIRMPIVCNQCKDPKCADACPTGAITRVDGIVKINAEECIGCEQCVISCPFGAIYTHEDYNVPFKCDLCGGDPECVKACPKDAIIYIPRHIIGQPQRMKSVLKYAHLKEVEYWEDGEKKILRYTETEDKGTNDEA